ncbi:MAG: CYTH domain-containing protein [Planctomycetes bacterium]|nr:CYTH domain-containing protein [Planctomycetota bacterium]
MPDFANNRELKHYCPDFRQVRRVLRSLGARREPPRTQVDTYYRLPHQLQGQPGPRWRLKLRVERGRRTLVHYADAYDADVRTVRYALADVTDAAVGGMLAAALGVSAVVRKRREQWHAHRTLFNLDTIEGVGRVFEAEVAADDPAEAEALIARYRALFDAYLGPSVGASNEDLLAQ